MKKYIRKIKYFIIFALCLVLTPNAVAQVAGTPYIPMVTVSVTPDISGNYALDGKMCYDVAVTNHPSDECMPLDVRVNDFDNNTFIFDYTFTNSASFTDLVFSIKDDVGGVIQSVATAGNIGKVTFKSNVRTLATGLTKTNAFTFTLVATFKDNTGALKEITIPGIKVQDCCCGCAVRSTYLDAPYNGWIVFQCHNVGVTKPEVKTKNAAQQAAHTTPADLYGDLYQWGRVADGHEKRSPAPAIFAGPVTSSGAFDAHGQILSSNAAYSKFITSSTEDWRSQKNDLWDMSINPTNNPCEPGWRVPTGEEMQSIVNGNSTNVPAGLVMSGNYLKWNNTGTNGWLIYPGGTDAGTPTVFLPAGGWHEYANGQLEQVGAHGYYWTSSTNGKRSYLFDGRSDRFYPAFLYQRVYAVSVRCVLQIPDYTPDVSGNYGFSGKTCYDVARTDKPAPCMPLSARTDDFASTLTFDYTFTNSASFTELSFHIDDNVPMCVESVARVGNTCKLTFRNSVHDIVSATSFTLVARFKDNTGQYKKLMLPITVQDCSCTP